MKHRIRKQKIVFYLLHSTYMHRIDACRDIPYSTEHNKQNGRFSAVLFIQKAKTQHVPQMKNYLHQNAHSNDMRFLKVALLMKIAAFFFWSRVYLGGNAAWGTSTQVASTAALCATHLPEKSLWHTGAGVGILAAQRAY